MENQYGILVTNKFGFLIDDEADPLELLEQAEVSKKKKDEQAKKEEKGKAKSKTGKKGALQEQKSKQADVIAPKKEEKVNAPKPNDRPRGSARQNREPKNNRDRQENDSRPPRRRDENYNPENREKSDRSESGGFGRPERIEGGGSFGRSEGGGFGRSEGGGFGRSEGGGGFGRSEGGGFGRSEGGGFGRSEGGGFGRGEGGGFGRGRGPRRGGRGGRGAGRGGFDRKREFDRHSGSERTGVKPTDKRDGGGAHNWGTVKDDIEEQLKDVEVPEANPDWNPQSEDAENQDPNESTESAPAEEDPQPQQLTLDEWKKMQEKNRLKSEFKTRKAGEGVDKSQWKNGRVYKKAIPEGESEEEEEEEESEEEEEDLKSKRIVDQIRITFNDSPRRGRGGRRPRGGRMGRGGSGRGSDRKNPSAAPKFDDENDFPMLVKTEA